MKASSPSRNTCGRSVVSTRFLPPLPQFDDVDRAIDQDNDDGENQRAGHQADGARQVNVAVVHDAQDGGQQQQGRDEFE